jgi:hypothetical protein
MVGRQHQSTTAGHLAQCPFLSRQDPNPAPERAIGKCRGKKLHTHSQPGWNLREILRQNCPATGSSYLWELTTSSWVSSKLRHTQDNPTLCAGDGSPATTEIHRERWDILGKPADSAGWRRLEVMSNEVTPLHLRFNLRTGTNMREETPVDDVPEEGWWRHWSDRIEGNVRISHSWSTQSDSTSRVTHSLETLYRSTINGLDSSLKILTDGDTICPEFRISVSRRLISVNSNSIRAAGVKSSDRSNSRTIRPFSHMAVKYPNTQVQWTDLHGRTGKVNAGQLLGGNRAIREVLMIDATFPDNSHWKGALFHSRP